MARRHTQPHQSAVEPPQKRWTPTRAVRNFLRLHSLQYWKIVDDDGDETETGGLYEVYKVVPPQTMTTAVGAVTIRRHIQHIASFHSTMLESQILTKLRKAVGLPDGT